LTPLAGAHDLLGISHHGWPVEALSERVSDQGSRCDKMFAEPAVDIFQQALSLFDGDATL
jgi:hypothetical protein